jgi:hypothetical protein
LPKISKHHTQERKVIIIDLTSDSPCRIFNSVIHKVNLIHKIEPKMKTVQLCDSYIDTYDKILTLIFESLDHQLSDINKL